MRKQKTDLTDEEMLVAMKEVAYLASCSLRQEAPDAHRLDEMDVSLVLRMARRHQMDGICAMALERGGVHTGEVVQAVAKATKRAVLFQHEWELISEQLEQAGIWYMSLKGMVLKDLYPAIEMRQMSDIDVLFDESRAEDVRLIMEHMGYETETFGERKDDIYKKQPIFNVEMHRRLFFVEDVTRPIYAFFLGMVPEGRLVAQDEARYICRMSNEDLYLYVTAHSYMHFMGAGTGLRSFMDEYVFLQHYDLRWPYIHEVLEALGMAQFEAEARGLAQRLFGGLPLTAKDEGLLLRIGRSGTYGTHEQYAKNKVSQFGGGVLGGVRFVHRRVWLSPDVIRTYYPAFYSRKYLWPMLPAYRLVKTVTHKPRAVLQELKGLFG